MKKRGRMLAKLLVISMLANGLLVDAPVVYAKDDAVVEETTEVVTADSMEETDMEAILPEEEISSDDTDTELSEEVQDERNEQEPDEEVTKEEKKE